MKRVFLIVLDSLGIGYLPNADKFGDKGANTLKSISKSKRFDIANLQKMGIGNIDIVGFIKKNASPTSAHGRCRELSAGKDTTVGHWEIAGAVSEKPLPTYPNGFPNEIISEFEKATGRKVICNKTYSGTEVIADYGKEHMETGALIVYTSADSVFQVAAHEDIVSTEELYKYCAEARRILRGEHAVGRVIARPFTSDGDKFVRTQNRRDFSLECSKITLLDTLKEKGFDVISIGKIYDIFAKRGITEYYLTHSNQEGIEKTIELTNKDFNGLCFVNLVDFDMLYGHRNDVDGYAEALSYFDEKIPEITENLSDEDVLIITADHGCDPGYKTTDHTREYIPLLVYGKKIKPINLGTRKTYGDISSTIAELLGSDFYGCGKSFASDITEQQEDGKKD